MREVGAGRREKAEIGRLELSLRRASVAEGGSLRPSPKT